MAINSYAKDKIVQLSKNFKSSEFQCPCGKCSETLIDDKLVEYLQALRDKFNKPLNISSGYRCLDYNTSIGSSNKSYHAKGSAADIYIMDYLHEPKIIAQEAERMGIKGIGLYENSKGQYFVHVDTRTNKVFWKGHDEVICDTFQELNTSYIKSESADPKYIWDYLKKQGLNDFGVAGLMGNLNAESALRSANLQNTYEKSLGLNDVEYTAKVDNGTYTNFVNDKAGYGLAQWTYYTRKQRLLDFCKSKGTSISDLDMQLEFLVWELKNNFRASVWNVLVDATSVLEASNAVLFKFEAPADQSEAVQTKRASYGAAYYAKYSTPVAKIVTPTAGKDGKMKYNKNNKPLVCMMTQSTCYKETRTMDIKGILWHSTGANNPNLCRYVQPDDNAPDRQAWIDYLGKNKYNNDWNHIYHEAGLNCWIGYNAAQEVTTVQTMPWDYRPWGCGSGKKGSCNSGWIQFEICEADLNDAEYFKLAYQEACEITAYLCDLYGIDPHGTAEMAGVKVPTILCHYDSYKLGFGGNHSDIDHWFPRHGKSMTTVRDDVAALLKASGSAAAPAEPEPETKPYYYRVRKSWKDASSQKGAYTVLENAKKRVDELGAGYYVFDEDGKVVYPLEVTVEPKFADGATVKLKPEATYYDGGKIPTWLFNSLLYVRDTYANGDVVISTLATGAVTGVVNQNYLEAYVIEEVKPQATKLKSGDLVKLTKDAVYFNGKSIPSWVFAKTLYVRGEPRANGDVVVSTVATGPITGVVNQQYLELASAAALFQARVTANLLNIRREASSTSAIVGQTQKDEVHNIYTQKGNWGQTKVGWIYLPYTKRV